MENVKVNSDGLEFKLMRRKWEEFHGITAAFITLNESENILEFIKHIRPIVTRIVMIDGGSVDNTVELAKPYVDVLKIVPFKGHFAEQKNIALSFVYSDWTLFLDPDERLSDEARKKIPKMIEQDDFDCYKFPRREFIGGEENKDPYPDYQSRLFRTYCRFVRPIHEEVVGWKECKSLEENSIFDILHHKKKNRHIERNSVYPFFGMHYVHEIGSPGEQVRETFKEPKNLITDRDGEK